MQVNIKVDESIDDLQLNGLRLIQKENGFRFVERVEMNDIVTKKTTEKTNETKTIF